MPHSLAATSGNGECCSPTGCLFEIACVWSEGIILRHISSAEVSQDNRF
jgi:hypothetical protein